MINLNVSVPVTLPSVFLRQPNTAILQWGKYCGSYVLIICLQTQCRLEENAWANRTNNQPDVKDHLTYRVQL